MASKNPALKVGKALAEATTETSVSADTCLFDYDVTLHGAVTPSGDTPWWNFWQTDDVYLLAYLEDDDGGIVAEEDMNVGRERAEDYARDLRGLALKAYSREFDHTGGRF